MLNKKWQGIFVLLNKDHKHQTDYIFFQKKEINWNIYLELFDINSRYHFPVISTRENNWELFHL